MELSREQFYHTEKWKRLRATALRRDKYQCQLSKRFGKLRQAEMVHHIFPREQFPEYQWELWNLISLTNEMHNKLHDRVTNNLTSEGMALLVRTAKKQGIGIKETMSRTLVIGLSGTGKSTYVKNHLTNDSLAYDLDAIASAFRLRMPHEEYHAQARRMANDLLLGFVENASDYTTDLYIIRTAPTIEEVEDLKPDKVVWCKHQYIDRPMDDAQAALDRIQEVIDWCKNNSIPFLILPPSP